MLTRIPCLGDKNSVGQPAVAGIVINSRDITARKEAEGKFELFRTLLERSNDAIYVLSPMSLAGSTQADLASPSLQKGPVCKKERVV